MIRVTAYSLKALLVVPLVLGLVDAVLAIPGVGELISSYVPLIPPRTLLLTLFGLLFVSVSALRSSAHLIEFISWIYVIPPILVIGVFNEVMGYFGIKFTPWGLNMTYLAYFVVALPLAHVLDETVRRANRLEKWGVKGYDGALHGVLGSMVLLLLSAGVLSLFYYKEVTFPASLPPYSFMVVIFVLGLAALVGFLPERAGKTVAFVKVRARIGSAYEVSVVGTGEETSLEVRDYGAPQIREFSYSFKIMGKPPESVLVRFGDKSVKARRIGETTVDGTKYVVYSDRAPLKI